MTSNRPPAPRDNRGGNFPHRPQFPSDYLKKGYFDDKGYMLPQVIVDWPKAIADALFNSRPQMTSTQLRGAFFAEVRRLEKRLEVLRDFDAIRADLLKLDPLAENRKNKNKVPPLFKEFITANLRWASQDAKDFRGFVNHFECVVGYYPQVRGN